MNKTITLLFFILFISLKSFSQKQFSAEILTGFGINKNLKLVNEDIEGYNIYLTQINVNYKFKLYKNIFAETGLGSQWYFSSGKVAKSNFKTTSLKLNLPVIISHAILNKINIGVGVAISNNKDFEDFDFRTSHNLRSSLIFKGSYAIKEDFDLVLMFKHNLSDIPNLYLINQPNSDLSIGISYKLF
ncbi:hypothetical protein GCM10022291_13130 [Postechiella marina]|uniref:Outer membrane protein beta-barrel domain-containing protein n=1 Tax=Postechiella marina TaxID=943941 RepID=A0ABP8C5U6_9FLAO